MHCHCGTNNRAPRWTFTDPCKPEVRPGAREESACPAWPAAHAMNARDTTEGMIKSTYSLNMSYTHLFWLHKSLDADWKKTNVNTLWSYRWNFKVADLIDVRTPIFFVWNLRFVNKGLSPTWAALFVTYSWKWCTNEWHSISAFFGYAP